MQPIAKLKKQLFAISAAMLLMVFAAFSLTGKISPPIGTSEVYYLGSQDSQLEAFLEGNVSQVANLKEQIIDLEEEINELESIIARQNSENEKLKKQVGNLNGYSRIKPTISKWTLPSGVKFVYETNVFNAFVTFFC